MTEAVKKDHRQDLPHGWYAAGSGHDNYEFSLDTDHFHSGKASGKITAKTKSPQGFGTLLQDFSADQYRGKRMKFSAFVKSENVAGWAGLWMRVEGAGQDVLGFDNMKNRPITGTNDWSEYSIVLDVPQDAKLIGFGMLLSGEGSVWLDDASFDEVSTDTPVTNMEKPYRQEPVNLSFDHE